MRSLGVLRQPRDDMRDSDAFPRVFDEKIAEILKGSDVQQIAVGAAHLAGPDSLQVQLAKRGITVERH